LENKLERLLQRESIGLALRVFAPKPELVEKQAGNVLGLAKRAAALKQGEKLVFKKILILVAEDARRIHHDCGETAAYLREQLRTMKMSQVQVVSCKTEDLFCGILNTAATKLLRAGCKYMTVCSSEAADYLDTNYVEKSAQAFEEGAVATGLAITELQQSIMDGILANTAMMWDVEAL
jgi:ribosomal protein L7Ae-like RNA K-turn-binding protein